MINVIGLRKKLLLRLALDARDKQRNVMRACLPEGRCYEKPELLQIRLRKAVKNIFFDAPDKIRMRYQYL